MNRYPNCDVPRGTYCCSNCRPLTNPQHIRSSPRTLRGLFNHPDIQSDRTASLYDARWTMGIQETIRLFKIPHDTFKEWHLHVAGRLSPHKPKNSNQRSFGSDSASGFLERRGWVRNDLGENCAWLSNTTSWGKAGWGGWVRMVWEFRTICDVHGDRRHVVVFN